MPVALLVAAAVVLLVAAAGQASGTSDTSLYLVQFTGNPLEAQYFGAIAVGAVGAAFGSGGKVTTLDLSGVGDDARGELLQLTGNGRSAYEAVLALTHGTYLDFVGAVSPAPLTAADVSRLARRAAKRLDAGF